MALFLWQDRQANNGIFAFIECPSTTSQSWLPHVHHIEYGHRHRSSSGVKATYPLYIPSIITSNTPKNAFCAQRLPGRCRPHSPLTLEDDTLRHEPPHCTIRIRAHVVLVKLAITCLCSIFISQPSIPLVRQEEESVTKAGSWLDIRRNNDRDIASID